MRPGWAPGCLSQDEWNRAKPVCWHHVPTHLRSREISLRDGLDRLQPPEYIAALPRQVVLRKFARETLPGSQYRSVACVTWGFAFGPPRAGAGPAGPCPDFCAFGRESGGVVKE